MSPEEKKIKNRDRMRARRAADPEGGAIVLLTSEGDMKFKVGDKVTVFGAACVISEVRDAAESRYPYRVQYPDGTTGMCLEEKIKPTRLKFLVGDQFAWDRGVCTVIDADRNKTPPYKIVYQGATRTKDMPVLDADVEWSEPVQCTPPKPTNPNPKKAFGETKPNLALVPPSAHLHMAMAMELGAERYGAFNWRDSPVEAMTYIAASLRHIQNFLDGEDYCSDAPHIHNLGAAMAGLGILLDSAENGDLIDNRPKPGKSSQIQERMRAQKIERARSK